MQRCSKDVQGSKLRIWLVAIVVSVLLPGISLAGQAESGRKLFTGEKSFKNGAPPCISCHNASDGVLGGGSLGPDLTEVMVDDSRSGLVMAEWINDEGNPTMGQIFSRHEVTEEEVEDLKAFLTVQGSKGVKTSGAQFAGGGIVGFIGLMILITVLWSGRYRNRNKGTAHEAMWRNYGGKGGA